MTAADSKAHFREHDVEIFQDRTKLWLEAVLGENYGDRPLAELIADGFLLYRVSQYITREMTGASPGPQEMSPKTISEVAAYGKNSGKYLPYANVDTFLKICKRVGLTDVELFTPPDAVEGKDVRRVCTSIRSLARKARAQHIKVPDFEDVNRPLPMPKGKVGEIKENLRHYNSVPVTPRVASPEEDIRKSERVQIISKFLSATKSSPSNESGEVIPANTGPRAQSDASTHVRPELQKTFPFDIPFGYSPSTPNASIRGVQSPALRKSLSAIEPSPAQDTSLKSSLTLTPKTIGSDKKTTTTLLPSVAQPGDGSEKPSLSLSQRNLASFRHAQPHFIKEAPLQTNSPSPADDPSDKVPAPEPTPVKTTSSTMADSADLPADQIKGSSSVSQLGMGAYTRPQQHFSSKKSSEADLSDDAHSHDLQAKHVEVPPDTKTPKASSLKPRAPSPNKIVEKDSGSSMLQMPTPSRTHPSSITKASHTPPPKEQEPSGNPEAKTPVIQINSRLWIPLVAGALAFMGTLLVIRSRDPAVYEVKPGDTLSKISKKVGKNNWDELVRLNPSILNPNLIYPSERLKLPV